jgi:predicted nucleotidyltransferase
LNATGAPLAKLQTDLREFIVLLNSFGVEFLVVGGHAVAFHGHPRFTGDIDFFIRTTPQNVERVLRTLDAFGFGSLGIAERDLLEPGQVVQLGRPPNRIDLLTSISGVDFESAWQARVEGSIDDERVSFLGFEELLKNKEASGRQKDLADIEKLLAVAKRRG